MERLTKWSEEDQHYITPYCDTANCDRVCEGCEYEQKIINRLAEFEDKFERGELGNAKQAVRGFAEMLKAWIKEKIRVYGEMADINAFELDLIDSVSGKMEVYRKVIAKIENLLKKHFG